MGYNSGKRLGGFMMEHTQHSTKQLTMAALFIAMTAVATMVISIPIPGTHGFVNLGDSFVLLGGLLFSHYYGALIGGVGSAMADLFLGYSFYAPITFIVKGVEGLLAGWIYRDSKLSTIIAVVVAVIWMPIGYFIFEALLFGVPIALASVVANYIQGAVGGAIALILFPILKRFID